MFKLKLLSATLLLAVLVACGPSKEEVEKHIVGTWTIDNVDIDFDADKLSEEDKKQYEANKEMMDKMMDNMKESFKGQSMTFNADGTSSMIGGTSGKYTISDDGKYIMGEKENQKMEISSISADKMNLTMSDKGVAINMELSKSGDGEKKEDEKAAE